MALTERMTDWKLSLVNPGDNSVSLSRVCFVDKDDVEIMNKGERVDVKDNPEIAALLAQILDVAVKSLQEI